MWLALRSWGSVINDTFMAKSDRAKRGRSPRVRIAVLAYEGCSSWVAAGLLELFATANLPSLPHQRRRPFFECVIISATGRAVRASQGVLLPSVAPAWAYDAVIVPPLWYTSRTEFEQRVYRIQKITPLLQKL